MHIAIEVAAEGSAFIAYFLHAYIEKWFDVLKIEFSLRVISDGPILTGAQQTEVFMRLDQDVTSQRLFVVDRRGLGLADRFERISLRSGDSVPGTTPI